MESNINFLCICPPEILEIESAGNYDIELEYPP